MTKQKGEDAMTGLEIAVIGMAGRFPGAGDIDRFWNNLKKGVESICFYSDQEIKELRSQTGVPGDANYVKAQGVLDHTEYFDADFFDITPKEAGTMDPQTRIFLECSWQALEDAGYDPGAYPGLIGIYAGSTDHTLWLVSSLMATGSDEAEQMIAGHLARRDFLTMMVSYKLNLKGPSYMMQTTCSTSLSAVHLASRALLTGECHMALAGGVSIVQDSREGYIYQEGVSVSPDGHCRAFDARADGAIFNDGAGIVVLKRLEDALADKDYIYALIKGTAINNDGNRKAGFTAPSVEGQAEVIRAALDISRVEPESIGYIETHGTGTPLGDPIEMEGLKLAFKTRRKRFCRIGSVKTNVGHLNCAAGVAGLIKTVMILKHRFIPPSLHYESPNPNIDFENSHFFVNREPFDWKNERKPLRAGVSSFGIGGTNAHVILEEWSTGDSAAAAGTGQGAGYEQYPYQLIFLSARTETALEKMTENLANYLKRNPGIDLADVAYTLQVGRRIFPYRRFWVCPAGKEAGKAAEILSNPDARWRETFRVPGVPRIVFMFPGQGAQYTGMGWELYQTEPLFREEMNRCFEILQPLVDYDIKEILYPLNRTEISQSIIFIFEYALAQLLIKWGIEPRAMIGYSMGEYTAACVSGVLSVKEALELLVYREQLLKTLPPGGMTGAPFHREKLESLLREFYLHNNTQSPALALAIDNGLSCVVSGPKEHIRAFEKYLGEKEILCMRVNTPYAPHSPMMEPIIRQYQERVGRMNLKKPQIPYISNVTGEWITWEQVKDPGYWARHLRDTVRFGKGMQELVKNPDTILVEVGPGRDLRNLAARYIENNPDRYVVNLVRPAGKEESDVYYLLNQLGYMWLYGKEIQWNSFHRKEKKNRIPLPTYPFEGRKYRSNDDISGLEAKLQAGIPLLAKKNEVTDWFYYPSWEKTPLPFPVSPGDGVPVPGSWLIFADDEGIGNQVAEKLKQKGVETVLATMGETFRRMAAAPGSPGQANPAASKYILDVTRPGDYDLLIRDLVTRGKVPGNILHMWSISFQPGPSRGVEDFNASLYPGFYSLVFFIQALGRQGIARTITGPARLQTDSAETAGHRQMQLIVVTNNVFSVTGDEELYPERATILGPCKTIPQEMENMTCRSIDIVQPRQKTGNASEISSQLELELLQPTRDLTIAYRGNSRWVQCFKPMPLERPPGRPRLLKKGGVYWITGGLGKDSLIRAGYLAENLKAKLILTGRTPLPPRGKWDQWLSEHGENPRDDVSIKIKTILDLEARGAEVLTIAADVSKENDMRRVLEEINGTFGRLDGVIHAAGATSVEFSKLIMELTPDVSQAHFLPKVYGLYVLQEILEKRVMDFCLLTSSRASITGGLGISAYTAANIFMDSFANRRIQETGTPWISLNWQGASPEETNRAFQRVLNIGPIPQLVVSQTPIEARIDERLRKKGPGAGTKKAASGEGEESQRHRSPRPNLRTPYQEPYGETENALVRIWQGILGFNKIGTRDDFFEIGGDSLKAAALTSKIHKEFHVSITLPEIFEKTTIKDLAQHIEGASQERYAAIEPVEQQEYYQLSSAQKRLYILDELAEKSIGYRLTSTLQLEGCMENKRFEEAFMCLIKRHESLRTSFEMVEGVPIQRIHKEVDFEIEYCQPLVNCQGRGEVSSPINVEKIILNFIRPFDLSRAPLLRVGLIKDAEQKHILMVDMHHIISDGVSMGIIVKEFMAAYSGKKPAGIRIQYKDFSGWQNSKEVKEAAMQQENFWLKEFAGEIPVLDLPGDFARPAIQSFEGGKFEFEIKKMDAATLNNLALDTNVTLFILLLAIYNIFLSKLSGQEDIVVGSPLAGRRHSDLENIVGMFVNTLALRNFPGGEKTFIQFLNETKDRTLAAFENQEYQFEDVVEKVEVMRDTSRNPLFDTMFAVQNFEIPGIKIPGLTLKPYNYDFVTSKFDLALECLEIEEKLYCCFEYSTNLFKSATIQRFSNYFKKITGIVIRNPGIKISDIRIISEEEKTLLLFDFNDTRADYPDEKTLPQLFEEQVYKTPGNIAVVFAGRHLSYKELNRQASRLGKILKKKNVRPDTIVGIMVERSLEMVTGILGILKAGGAYLPIDPGYPQERIDFMLKDSGAAGLLIKTKTLEKFPFTVLQNHSGTPVNIELTSPRPHIKDLDALPIPNRSLIDYDRYSGLIGMATARHTIALQATRGCPYKCLYCHKIWPKTHMVRSAHHLFSEVRTYYRMGIRRFVMVDDTFNLNKKNSRKFFELLIKNRFKIQIFFPNGLRGDILTPGYIDLMVEAGVINISLALETASPRLQKLIRKNLKIEKLRDNMQYICKKHPQVILDLFTMHGFPTETEDEARMTMDFIKSLKWIHWPHINILKVYPDTEMADLCIANGISAEAIARSEDLAYHELPETLTFDRLFTIKYQAEYLDYFLSRERLLHVLPHQMKALTRDEIVQKYNSFLPTPINDFNDLLRLAGIDRDELGPGEFLDEESMNVPGLHRQMEKYFGQQQPHKHALKILLLDLSQFFSGMRSDMLYDVSEPPLGLMYLMTYLHKEYGNQVMGKIAKSRIDFDSFTQLKALVDEFKPDVVGMRALTFHRNLFHQTAAILRNYGFDGPIISGGPYATSDCKRVLQDRNIDVVVMGEGEITFARLIGEIMANNRKLPPEKTLRKIPGLAFVPGGSAGKGNFTREIFILDWLIKDIPGAPVRRLENLNKPGDGAYVIYTSGSTGRPKGVLIQHGSLVNRLNWMQKTYPLDTNDTLLQKTTYTFDVSVWEILWWSFTGAGLCLLKPGGEKDPAAIIETIEKNRVTVIHFVPSMLSVFLEYLKTSGDIRGLSCLKQVIVSGEALTVSHVNGFNEIFSETDTAGPKLDNLYGPTEATIDVSYFACPRGKNIEKIPIGKPIDNIQLYVMDQWFQLQPVGISGELCIAGHGLARGYINRPELTAEKFAKWVTGAGDRWENKTNKKLLRKIAGPGGETTRFLEKSSQGRRRLYKTGDLARWQPDRNIEFLGRIDNQVKIRGNRVELEEIESLLTSSAILPVKEAAVLARPDSTGDNRLIAYIVPDKKRAYTVFQLLELEGQESPGSDTMYQWPNGMPVYYLNRTETDFMYKEIFEDRSYIKHGISLKEGSCVLDVGANIGVFSLFVHRNCKNSRIYSFEPLPPVYRVLTINTSLYDGDIKTFNYGIGASEGEAIFTYYPHVTILSGSSSDQEQTAGIVRAFLSKPGADSSLDSEKDAAAVEEMYDELLAERLTTTTYTCKIKSLSQVIEENEIGVIDLLKIDVEKAEMEVLEGIKEDHWPLIRQLVIEVHEAVGEDNVLLPGITRLLERKGYRIAVEQEQLLENSRLYNLYAVREPGEEIAEPMESVDEIFLYSVGDLVQGTRDYLISKLPGYMVPGHIVPLTKLPLTASGKIDRKALPEPEFKVGACYRAPGDEIEKRLAALWSEILGRDVMHVSRLQKSIGIDDNFFELGGHSLKATILVSGIHRELNVKVPLAEVFQRQTIRRLSEYIRGSKKVKYAEINNVEAKEYYPLSSGQGRLYFIHRLSPGSTAYNISQIVGLEGALDIERLQDTFNKLIIRHESLCTSFDMIDGCPVQRIPHKITLTLEFHNIESHESMHGVSRNQDRIIKDFIRPFDLSKSPLIRVGIIKTGEKMHILMVDMHHIITDGISWNKLLRDFMDLYAGKDLPPLKLQYKDFSEWENKPTQKAVIKKQEEYWLKELSGELLEVKIPTDFSKSGKWNYEGGRYSFEINERETGALREMALREGATMHILLLTIYKVLLAKLSGQEDIIVGMAIAGRRHTDLEHIIGMFLKMLAIRSYPGGEKSFNEFLREVRLKMLSAYDNQDYQFDQLVDKLKLNVKRGVNRHSLFNVHFGLQNMDMIGIDIPGLKLVPYEFENSPSKVDMLMLGAESEEKLYLSIQYNRDLFKEETIERFSLFFKRIVTGVIENPGRKINEIEVLFEEEKNGILLKKRKNQETIRIDFDL